MARRITVTEKDLSRITLLLDGVRAYSEPDVMNRRKLRDLLFSANVVPSREIPGSVVTMNSRVSVRDPRTGGGMVYTLVYPEMADYHKGFVSILAPLGTALIGACVGEVVCWEVPKGEKQLEIVDILYQPGISGDLHA